MNTKNRWWCRTIKL